MKKVICLLFIISFSLLGCKSDQDDAINKAKEEFYKVLLDANSARYENLVFYPIPTKNSTKGYVCGAVNSKNALGAYVGFREFYAEVGAITTITLEPKETESALEFKNNKNRYCHNYTNEEYRKIADIFTSNRNEVGILIINESGMSILSFNPEVNGELNCNEDCLINIGINDDNKFSTKIHINGNNPNMFSFYQLENLNNYLRESNNVNVTLPIRGRGDVVFIFDDKSYLR